MKNHRPDDFRPHAFRSTRGYTSIRCTWSLCRPYALLSLRTLLYFTSSRLQLRSPLPPIPPIFVSEFDLAHTSRLVRPVPPAVVRAAPCADGRTRESSMPLFCGPSNFGENVTLDGPLAVSILCFACDVLCLVYRCGAFWSGSRLVAGGSPGRTRQAAGIWCAGWGQMLVARGGVGTRNYYRYSMILVHKRLVSGHGVILYDMFCVCVSCASGFGSRRVRLLAHTWMPHWSELL